MPSPSGRAPRRLLLVTVIVAVLAIPPAALRLSCSFNTCATAGGVSTTRVPFCPLPGSLRDAIVAGFRAGRSPDVLGVTTTPAVIGSTAAEGGPSWPALTSVADMRVPIVFSGTGIAPGTLPAGTGLDQIAPTVATALDFARPHPEVRTGVSLPGVATGIAPRLVVLVAWKGVGSVELEAKKSEWPALGGLMDAGSGTFEGTTGSLPIDPAATLTTIGTGGLPYQHGVTGSMIRSDTAEVVAPWSAAAPPSVIAAFGDDLDQALGLAPKIGVVAPVSTDRGLIGGTWYPGKDDDIVTIAQGASAQRAAVEKTLAEGFGSDATPDILGVVMQGSIAEMDRELRAVVSAAGRASHGSTLVVVAGTGTWTPSGLPTSPMQASALVNRANDATGLSSPIVEAAVPGGIFLDQAALEREHVSGQVAQKAMLDLKDSAGAPLMNDTFQAFAVSFARYC